MPDRCRVLVAEPLGAAGADRLRSDPDVEAVFAEGQSRAELLESVRGAAALIVRSGSRVDAEMISAGPGLRVIGRAGVGVDNIDLEAAAARGIAVVNTPEANMLAAAEHAFALMLAAARRVTEAHNSLAAGKWDRKQYVGVQLAGATLGLVGFGRIGRAVGRRALAFEMAVLTTDPYIPAEVAREHGARMVELPELLAASDFVSLHAVAQEDGSALLDGAALAAVKPGAIVVNAARGSLIDSAAARAALDDGRLGGLGLDVYDQEPPPPDHPLIGHPRVVHTPHLGASTGAAQRDVSVQVVAKVLAALRGEPVEAVRPLAPSPGWR
ncbi:MAG: hydroxyacid dehydrogenase [Acidimicrobiaceae bacterium]|nr:hydroxyacid dehydrogenase [Acidimicrobiaceae bacterium]